jgi:hypothetical protein
MKDKKFVILIALAIAWLVLFAGTAMGELKLSPNVERFATVIVLVYFAYWSYSVLRWVKKPEPTEEPPTHNLGDHLTGKCGCSNHKKSPKS